MNPQGVIFFLPPLLAGEVKGREQRAALILCRPLDLDTPCLVASGRSTRLPIGAIRGGHFGTTTAPIVPQRRTPRRRQRDGRAMVKIPRAQRRAQVTQRGRGGLPRYRLCASQR